MKPFHQKDVMYIKTVTLRVNDIDKMLDFYVNVLKMTLIKTHNHAYDLGTKSGRVLVRLTHDKSARVNKGRRTGLYHFALLLPSRHDLGVFLNDYLANNHPLSGASDHAVSEALYLNDPEGNGIEIYCDRPAEAWVFNPQGIVMKTEPLDHVSLMKEKGDYTHLPDETVMGHLHLHVNDIVIAKQFFIETLGFNLMLDYGPSASFVSDANYHHHLAFNTWMGQANPHLEDGETGLIAYEVNLPNHYVHPIKERLMAKQVPYQVEANDIVLKDMNGTTIFLVKQD